jgi:hypothetical protein
MVTRGFGSSHRRIKGSKIKIQAPGGAGEMDRSLTELY